MFCYVASCRGSATLPWAWLRICLGDWGILISVAYVEGRMVVVGS